MQMDGYPMLKDCGSCGGSIDEETPECSTCTCDEEDYYDFDDMDWQPTTTPAKAE